MRITVLDGTPQEIAEYAERTRFFTLTEVSTVEGSEQPGSGPLLDSKILQFVESKAGNHAMRRQFVEMYLQRVVDLGGVEIEIGTSSRTKDGQNHYLMIRDSGPRRFGAVAYVRPSTAGVNVRLPSSAADGYKHARSRNLSNPDRAYQIVCHLRSEEAVAEAVALTQEALRVVRSKEDTNEGRR